MVDLLLQAAADVGVPPEVSHGHLTLVNAISSGNAILTHHLIFEKGVKVDAATLHRLCYDMGSPAVMNVVLQGAKRNDAGVDVLDSSGCSPLLVISRNPEWVTWKDERTAILRKLLAAGADPNFLQVQKSSIHGLSTCTPLLAAMKSGRTEIMEILIEAGASVCGAVTLPQSVASRQGYSRFSPSPPMIAICKYGECNNPCLVMECLIRHGASVDALCPAKGRSPLHWLCATTAFQQYGQKKNRQDLVELLIVAGADIHARDWEGQTALELAEQNYLVSSDIKNLLNGSSHCNKIIFSS